MQSRMVGAATILALVATAALALVATASAGKLFSETIDETESRTEANFCGVEGLTVDFTSHIVGRVQAVPHGRDQLPYFSFNLKITDVVTNLANRNDVVSESTIRDKDLRVTDNGDGTLTLLVLSTGNSVLYGEDGKVIARNPGQVRFEILIDHGGTPTDPSDDEELAFLGVVKESTGRNDDFCEFAVPILTATP
jgi:hypothetical protein